MENQLKNLGIACPECQSFVQTPVEQILFSNNYQCQSCKLEFSLGQENSDNLIRKLQELNFSF